MALGKLFHYALDAVFVSTVLAGVRRSSGFRPDTTQVPEGTVRTVADTYLGVGETIFDMIQGTAVNSEYFKRDTRR
ncbi:DUF1748-domain-containing protein [Gloeophyllum trabeum ATCC 11539]|uniref:DUF1748-domain-containing protein n=1 Tax=Gloeophyllum trabeum (strain ATCC 11539 / FP-39264 / Madison 617) TaxID=670483 RepID=S7PZS4_GLOTA|nr:DUF1748-domain-containing protein [Gloeophyllum trabeum ATCC 11539]EPQ52792.1 DUF1748-domain-containing protein [Gloeophyllum trabeum ATCC 11539]